MLIDMLINRSLTLTLVPTVFLAGTRVGRWLVLRKRRLPCANPYGREGATLTVLLWRIAGRLQRQINDHRAARSIRCDRVTGKTRLPRAFGSSKSCPTAGDRFLKRDQYLMVRGIERDARSCHAVRSVDDQGTFFTIHSTASPASVDRLARVHCQNATAIAYESTAVILRLPVAIAAGESTPRPISAIRSIYTMEG